MTTTTKKMTGLVKTRFARTDWENDSWLNRDNHEHRWNYRNTEIPNELIEHLENGESVKLFVIANYHQFRNHPTEKTALSFRVTPVESSSDSFDGDTYVTEEIEVIRVGNSLKISVNV